MFLNWDEGHQRNGWTLNPSNKQHYVYYRHFCRWLIWKMMTISSWLASKYRRHSMQMWNRSWKCTKGPHWSVNRICPAFHRMCKRCMWMIMSHGFQVRISHHINMTCSTFVFWIKIDFSLCAIVIAVSIGPAVYFYKNVKPYFKYTFPSLPVDPLEKEIWKKVVSTCNHLYSTSWFRSFYSCHLRKLPQSMRRSRIWNRSNSAN